MSLSANLGLEIDPSVFRSLQKLPQKDAKRLLGAIHLLPANPYAGDITKMKGIPDTWRRRLGAYRIFYKLLLRERKTVVFRIERRTSVTY